MADSPSSSAKKGRASVAPKEPPTPAPATVPAPVAPGLEPIAAPQPPAPTAPAPPASPPAPARANKGLQLLVEGFAITSFLAMALVPLARFGLVPLTDELVIGILVLASLLLTAGALLFGPANYQVKRQGFDQHLQRKYRQEMILTSLSIGGTFVVLIMLLLEAAALLAFLGFLSRQSETSIAFAGNYVLFGTFTLLYCSMLLIVRTSFHTRATIKPWHKGVALGLLAMAGVISLLSVFVVFGLLTRGVFAAIEPRQSIYIFTFGVLFQIIAFKMLLRYPAISQIVVKEIEAARRANKEMRDVLQRRAIRAYLLGLAFVLLSMFLVGGIAGGQVAVGSDRSLGFIVGIYLIVGAIVMGIVVTRYFQHKYLEGRARRAKEGEVIAKRRLSRAEINRRIMFVMSGTFGALFTIVGLAVLLGAVDALKPKYGTDFLIGAFLVGVGPYGWYRGRLMKRIRAMDDKFPDFLRDLAESERAGMTLPRALATASKGVYGALTPEIRRMSAQVEWGVSFTEALQRFSRRVNTPLIQRTVALIVEASKAGGNVIDILTAASDDAREIKQILEERGRQMGIYGIIIYISFMVFLVVVFILAAQFLPAFSAAAGKGSGAKVSGASIAAFSVDEFTTIFFHAALVQGIGGGLVSGIMQQGHPMSGLKHAVIMTCISWFFFRVLIG